MNVKRRASALEWRIEGLEDMVLAFKSKLRGVARDFDGLKKEIDHLSLEFEAMEDDHMAALDCLREEKFTSQEYAGKLRDAEAEIELLHQSLPTKELGEDTLLGGFSQAQSTKPVDDGLGYA